MAWSDLEKKPPTAEKEKLAEEHRALGAAVKATIGNSQYAPLKDFLMGKAHTVSFYPGVDPADVAFREGQRSLALQLLKLAGEIK